jgi:hypothetical protein
VKSRGVIVVAFLLTLFGCGVRQKEEARAVQEEYPKDFSTPQGAILCLEDAYRRKDIDACLACNDFRAQAERMLLNLPKLKLEAGQIDKELLDKTIEVLELAYRKEKKDLGFPDMTGIKTRLSAAKPAGADRVIVAEEYVYSDGVRKSQELLMSKTKDGWRLVVPLKE